LLLAALLPAAPKKRQVGPGLQYSTPCKAIAAASDGDTIEIDAKGDYTGDVCTISKNRLTLRGVNGRPKIDAAGRSAGGKAIWVITGSDTVVENIEFTGATVGSKNGAGIRQEGRNLTVRNCYFHHNENGILTTYDIGTVQVEHSEFGWNGFGDGYSHNIYVGATAKFVLHASYMHHANKGNLVKSRAAVNVITYNRISQETGTGSWELDLPEGGQSLVMGNVIQQGAESVNNNIISFGLEPNVRPSSRMLFVHNTVVNTHPGGQFFKHDPSTRIEARNNIFAGKAVMGLNDPALPEGNILDPEMRFVNAGAYNYTLTAASPAINAAKDPGVWDDKPAVPEWQYVHPQCVQARTAVAAMDAGAFEYGLAPSGPRCGTAPAPVARLSGVRLDREEVVSGELAQGWVTLTSPADMPGLPVAVDSDSPALQISGTLLVPGGEIEAKFDAPTQTVAGRSEALVRAQFGDEQKTAKLVLLPKGIQMAKLASIAAGSRSVAGGKSFVVTVTLDVPAQPGGAKVTLTTSATSLAQVPGEVIVPENAQSTEVEIMTTTVGVSRSLVVTAAAESGDPVHLVMWVVPPDSSPRTPRGPALQARRAPLV
jgi:hypothetical protein